MSDFDPIVSVWPDGTIHTATRGSGLSKISKGTLVQAGCDLPGGALGAKKNKRHMRMLSGPLALRIVEAIQEAGFTPGEIVKCYFAWDYILISAFAEER